VISLLTSFFKRPTSFFLKVFVLEYLQPENYNIPVPSSWRSRRKQWVHWHRGDMTTRITNDNYLVRDCLSHLMAGCMVVGSTVFRWSSLPSLKSFLPSRLERILWRIAALVTTLAPLLLPMADRGKNTSEKLTRHSSSTILRATGRIWTSVIPLAVMLAYLRLRKCITVLIPSSLRAMPDGVYRTTWTKYFLSVH